MHFKLILEYDGTNYHGWQLQKNAVTIQGTLETALSQIFGDAIRVRVAGRTDAGVHALGQVAHVDLAKEFDMDTIRDALNAHLRPHPIAILNVECVADDFDARFSARARHYVYRITNRRADLALDRDRTWRIAKALDAPAMHDAAQRLVGNHDFTTFRSVECQAKSPVKTLDRLDVSRENEEIRIRANARSFLHHQVRSMVGSLALVGEGKWTADELAKALAAKNRAACGPVAPACGLYLVRVDY